MPVKKKGKINGNGGTITPTLESEVYNALLLANRYGALMRFPIKNGYVVTMNPNREGRFTKFTDANEMIREATERGHAIAEKTGHSIQSKPNWLKK